MNASDRLAKRYYVAAILMIVLGVPIFIILCVDYFGSTLKTECWRVPSVYRGLRCTPAATLEILVMALSLACAVTGLVLCWSRYAAKKRSANKGKPTSVIT
ncbi:MAG: hypothetical protein GYA24_25720 [Candidatus Lokiarchaeota archaeon]|nr:hypothetical protein [Candidatus Lokiarchaeota archaeon]